MKANLIVGTLLLAVAACSGEPPPAKVAAVRVDGDYAMLAEPDKAGFLKVAPAERDQGLALRLPGRLVWNEELTARIHPQAAGRVQRIAVDLGEAVKSGETLATLSSPDYGQARADAHRAQTDLRLARQALERSRQLREAGVIAEKDWQLAEAEAARAVEEADRAGRRLAGLGGDGDGTYVLKSPLAGIVVERNLSPGMEFRPDQGGPPLFVVTDPTRLWLQIDAAEADAIHLAPGEPLAVEVKQFPGQRFQGVVRRVAEFVDPTTRTVKVRAEVPNPERKLKGEMFVNALVELPPTNELHVPAAAVFLVGDRHYVFVEETPGTYRRQAVGAGNAHDGWVNIRAGLSEGDKVVVEGNLHLLKFFKPGSEKPKAQ